MKTHFDPSAYRSLADLAAKNPAVTPYSRWNDPTWYLEPVPTIEPSARALRWTLDAPRELIDRFRLVAALRMLVRDAPAGPAGAHRFSVGARHAIRFMAEHSILGFEEFGDEEFKLFVDHIHRTLSDPACVAETESEDLDVAHDGEDGEDGEDGDGDEDNDGDCDGDAGAGADGPHVEQEPVEGPTVPRSVIRRRNRPRDRRPQADHERAVSRSVARNRLTVWRDVVSVAPDLRRLGVGGLASDPFGRGKPSPGELAKTLARKVSESIPPLPDEVAKPILEKVHQLIGAPADDIIRLQREFLEIDPRGASWRPPAVRERLRTLMDGFEFSKRADGRSPWRAPIRLTDGGPPAGEEMRRLIIMLRDACAMVILGDTGVRISELCSIEVDDREIDGSLPSCVTIDTSVSELEEHFFMHGLLIKQQRTPKPEKWLLGARPLGSHWEPPGVRAIRVLERLLQPWRRLAGDPWLSRQLLVAFEPGLPRGPESVARITGGAVLASTRETIAAYVGLAERLAPLVAGDPELEPYATSNGRCIRLHQWRKTFLRYLIRIDEGLLPAISQHFKHMTLAITDGAYMPKDPALLDAADSVRSREVTRFLYERRYGTGRKPGKLPAVIAESDRQIDQLIGGRPYEQARPDLEAFARDHDLAVHSAPHGQCVIGLAPDHARCHRFTGRPAWEPWAPNLLARTASMCLGCANFSPGASSAEYWRRQYARNQSAWVSSGYDPTFRVPKARAQQAAAVLRQLGVPRPLILAKPPRNRPAGQHQKETNA